MSSEDERDSLQIRRLLPALTVVLVLAALLSAIVAVRRSQAQSLAVSDWRFGIIETYESPEDASASGAAWTRVRFQWADSQPGGPDEWFPPVTDSQINTEIAAGREVTGLLIGIPDWARDENLLPQGLWLPADDPGNLWANYVRRVVTEYQGRINHWVIWNEPDIWDKTTPGHTWDGEIEDFLQLHKTAYLVTKQANPSAIIHLSAFTYFWDANYGREQYFNRLLDALIADPEAAGNDYYFDVATAHLYFQPQLIYDILTAFQGMMTDHGLDKPIWLMETNAPLSDDPTWPVEDPLFPITEVEQAAFIPQAVASALAAGAERVGIFKLMDTDTDREANPEPFGLIRPDGSRRQAFETFRVAVQYFAGARTATRERWDEIGQIRLDQGDYATTVLFSRLSTPQNVQIAAVSDTAVLANMWGEQQQLQAVNGFFSVDLPAAICSQPAFDRCMIGGETQFLIQATAGGALPDTLPAPALSPTEVPPLTPTPNVTPIPTSPAITPEAEATTGPLSVPADFVQTDQALVDFPQSVTFQLALQPGHQIVDAKLNYGMEKRSCLAVDAEASADVQGNDVEWHWAMVRSGNPPPGSTLTWTWTLTDEKGQSYTTPRQSQLLSDDRFEWRVVEQDGIRLYWYEGEEVGPLLLEAALDAKIQLESEMGISLAGDVQIFIYGNANEMREAVLYTQDWAGGVAFTEYNTILMGVEPEIAESWGRSTIRHELTHLIVDHYGWSCVGGHRPTWLNEGLAGYAEGAPGDERVADIAHGIENDAFMPLRSLNGAFPAHDAGASMAYSQSYSVVEYLLQTYGSERMRTLLSTLAEGADYDQALEQSYGYNVDGLETEWRAAIGAPPRIPLPTATPVEAASIPTVQPLNGSQPVATAVTDNNSAASKATTTPLTCGLLAMPLLMIGLRISRRTSTKRTKT